jgi:hypothetical protein
MLVNITRMVQIHMDLKDHRHPCPLGGEGVNGEKQLLAGPAAYTGEGWRGRRAPLDA